MSSLFTSFPDELVLDIIARVPRCDYPKLSLVSKQFRSLVASPELYPRRSLLNCSEHCVYVALNNLETSEMRLYTLFHNRLVLIPSLPAMPWNARFVVVGSKIYVVSGVHSECVMMSIDCRSHTVQILPSLPIPKNVSAAGAIDGKIYVILDSEVGAGTGMLASEIMVFDTRTEKWEFGVIKPDIDVDRVWPACVVMADKIYMGDCRNCFYYEPKESKWEMEEEMWYFTDWMYACAVEDVSYYYNSRESELRGYDPKRKCWIVVKGVEELSRKRHSSCLSMMVGYGKKLVMFFPKSKSDHAIFPMETWCAEIALEKGQGEIWGKVEWCEVVITGHLCLNKPPVAVLV